MPIQMFNWVSRPDQEFQANAAAAGAILLVMTLLMNVLAIWIRYRFRKTNQLVTMMDVVAPTHAVPGKEASNT